MPPKLVTHHKLCCVCGEHYVRQHPPGVEPSPHCGNSSCKYAWDKAQRSKKDEEAAKGNALIGIAENALLSPPPPVVTVERNKGRMYTLHGATPKFFGGTLIRPGMQLDKYVFRITKVGPGAEYEAQHRTIGGRKRSY